MFAIRQKGTDVWAGAKNITYFVTSDSSLAREHWLRMFGNADLAVKAALENAAYFGVPQKRRRVFETTDAVRRALATITWSYKYEAIEVELITGQHPGKDGRVQKTFSRYELVNLVTGQVHELDAVLAKEI